MKHPITWGILGSMGIAALFYLVQALGMHSWTDPVRFTLDRWFYVLPLVVGFGVQMGLFQAIRRSAHVGGVVVASGGVSAGVMLACCMHNFVTLLPFLGLAGAAVFLAAYQDYLFIVSIAIMLLGIAYMWNKYRAINHECKYN